MTSPLDPRFPSALASDGLGHHEEALRALRDEYARHVGEARAELEASALAVARETVAAKQAGRSPDPGEALARLGGHLVVLATSASAGLLAHYGVGLLSSNFVESGLGVCASIGFFVLFMVMGVGAFGTLDKEDQGIGCIGGIFVMALVAILLPLMHTEGGVALLFSLGVAAFTFLSGRAVLRERDKELAPARKQAQSRRLEEQAQQQLAAWAPEIDAKLEAQSFDLLAQFVNRRLSASLEHFLGDVREQAERASGTLVDLDAKINEAVLLSFEPEATRRELEGKAERRRAELRAVVERSARMQGEARALEAAIRERFHTIRALRERADQEAVARAARDRALAAIGAARRIADTSQEMLSEHEAQFRAELAALGELLRDRRAAVEAQIEVDRLLSG